jgi:hypothetical protein
MPASIAVYGSLPAGVSAVDGVIEVCAAELEAEHAEHVRRIADRAVDDDRDDEEEDDVYEPTDLERRVAADLADIQRGLPENRKHLLLPSRCNAMAALSIARTFLTPGKEYGEYLPSECLFPGSAVVLYVVHPSPRMLRFPAAAAAM